MSIFSERLRGLRKQKGFTQKQVAETIGMKETVYQRYEHATREPAYKQLIALADAFDVSIDYLVGRSDNPNRN